MEGSSAQRIRANFCTFSVDNWHEPVTYRQNRLHSIRAIRLDLPLQSRFQIHLDEKEPRLWHWLRGHALKQPHQQIPGRDVPGWGREPFCGDCRIASKRRVAIA